MSPPAPQRRRLPPLYPGDVRRCPNGCPDTAPLETEAPTMPDWAPECGYWGTCCIYCGWVARFVLRYGDRECDLYWIIDEQVEPEYAARLREWGLRGRMQQGLGPWPTEEE